MSWSHLNDLELPKDTLFVLDAAGFSMTHRWQSRFGLHIVRCVYSSKEGEAGDSQEALDEAVRNFRLALVLSALDEEMMGRGEV